MSILPGFEYDIFISYRHNDNRSGWVTDFVNALQEELAATIKEPLSIYFDQNPHDGLLEIHNVDKSLEGKLKCLIFIPIVSQTYCDPKSFAWQHEFVVFNKLAKEDSFGRDIKLNNGNVASRILPIKIHDLDLEDTNTIEKEIGGVLRTIEFIYKEAGVNRPLKSIDSKNDNQNRTDYRNQINKTANAIKDILTSIKSPALKSLAQPLASRVNSKPNRKKEIIISLAVVILILNGYFFYPKLFSITEQDKQIEKTIAVLPFVNISDDPSQEFFCDGMTEEIITQLSNIQNLIVHSRSSSMSFKGTHKNLREIANELHVNFILEGSIRRSNNDLLITAQLINANRDANIWSDKFNGTLSDVFDIQENVSRSIVDKLSIELSSFENEKISQRNFENVQAFEYYLRASDELLKWNAPSFELARKHLESGLKIIGPDPVLYGGLAYTYWNFANMGIEADANYNLAEEFVQKTFSLDPNSPEGNLVDALINQTRYGNLPAATRSFKKVLAIKPYDNDALMWLSLSYALLGKMEAARSLATRLSVVDPISPHSHAMPLVLKFYGGHFDSLSTSMAKIQKMDPENSFWKLFTPLCLTFEGNRNEAVKFIEQNVERSNDAIAKLALGLKYALLSNKDSVVYIFNDPSVLSVTQLDCQTSQFASSIFALAGLDNEAISLLENAINRGFYNDAYLLADPGYEKLRNDQRFQKLVQRAKSESNKIED